MRTMVGCISKLGVTKIELKDPTYNDVELLSANY